MNKVEQFQKRLEYNEKERLLGMFRAGVGLHFLANKPMEYRLRVEARLCKEGEKPFCKTILEKVRSLDWKRPEAPTLTYCFGLDYWYLSSVIHKYNLPMHVNGMMVLAAHPIKTRPCFEAAYILTVACKSRGYTIKTGSYYAVDMGLKGVDFYLGSSLKRAEENAMAWYQRALLGEEP